MTQIRLHEAAQSQTQTPALLILNPRVLSFDFYLAYHRKETHDATQLSFLEMSFCSLFVWHDVQARERTS